MPKRRLLRLTTGAIMAVSAAMITTLAATGASAATTAAASSRLTAAAENGGHAATTAHGTGGVRIVRRGLVADCVRIELSKSGYYIVGGGVNKPVGITNLTANCFDLYNKFTTPCGGTKVCTGYEYQNGDGHCLFQNGGTIDLGAACEANHPNEEFYGTFYSSSYGWEVSNIAESSEYMYSTLCKSGDSNQVKLTSGVTLAACASWNFPSG